MGDAKRRAQLDPDFGRSETYTLHLFRPFSEDYLVGLSFTVAWSGSWDATNDRARALTALMFAYLWQDSRERDKIRELSRQIADKLSPATLSLLQQEKPHFPAQFWGRLDLPEAATGNGLLCSTPGEVYPDHPKYHGPSTVVSAIDPELLKLAS